MSRGPLILIRPASGIAQVHRVGQASYLIRESSEGGSNADRTGLRCSKWRKSVSSESQLGPANSVTKPPGRGGSGLR